MRVFLSLLSAVALVLFCVGGVSASPGDRTFHGTWDSAAWSGCEAAFGIPDGDYEASGTWNVSLFANQDKANVQWNLWDATGHYTFGGNKLGAEWTVAAVGSGPSFVVENAPYIAGTFTLEATGHLTATFDYAQVGAPGCTSFAYGELVH